MNPSIVLALLAATASIVYGIVLAKMILALPAGEGKMIGIAKAIQEGAMAYLKRQYTAVFWIGIILFAVIGFVPTLGWKVAVGFALGAILSALAGFFGMTVAVRAN